MRDDIMLILKGGEVLDAERLEAYIGDVTVRDGRIAEICPSADCRDARVLDCEGCYVTAGFIDAHVHIESSMVSPREFAKAVSECGTAAVIADPHEIVNVGGKEGMDAFLAMCEGAAADIFAAVPSCVPATPFDTNGAGEFLADDMKEYLSHPRVVGLGEVMCYPEVLAKDSKITDKIALFAGKCIDGHTAGLDGRYLAAYAEAGISNDHECVSYEDALKRIGYGMNVYIREGSAAHNLDAILTGYIAHRAAGGAPDVSKFAFCTDDKHLADIRREGHINYNFIRAIRLGLAPAEAARMASYNAARFYGLNSRGNIAEGLIADIAVIDKKSGRARYAVKNGKVIAIDQKLLLNMPNHANKMRFMQNSVKLRAISADEIKDAFAVGDTGIRLCPKQLITLKEKVTEENIADALTLVTAERHGRGGGLSKCALFGYGIKGGAVATSVSHDSHNAVAAGDSAEDIALALARMKEIGGGYVIAREGRIADELSLDIAGLMSSDTADSVEKKLARLDVIAKEMGVADGIDPFITLSFAALPVIPHIRLLDTGLFDVDDMKFM